MILVRIFGRARPATCFSTDLRFAESERGSIAGGGRICPRLWAYLCNEPGMQLEVMALRRARRARDFACLGQDGFRKRPIMGCDPPFCAWRLKTGLAGC